jgi:integrase/recombinase XerD
MGLGKQAKVLSNHQQNAVLNYLTTTRNPKRNQVIFLSSMKAGLRAKEIANLTWAMVTNADGDLGDRIALTDEATKGNSGGVVYMAKPLQGALKQLKDAKLYKGEYVIQSERCKHVSPQVIVNMFKCWYDKLGYEGCSSHSGRRTFITNAARKIGEVGGSIRDVQMLARHSSLQMTQLYIDVDKEAMRKVVDLV